MADLPTPPRGGRHPLHFAPSMFTFSALSALFFWMFRRKRAEAAAPTVEGVGEDAGDRAGPDALTGS
ncbi:MAG: hypothetical protein AB7I19_08895 [Planctomycetota bacterium]